MPTATTAAPIATIAQTAIIPTGKPAAVTPCEDACTTMSCTTIVAAGSGLRLPLKETLSPTNGREGVKDRTANGGFGGTTEIVRSKDAVALWSSHTTSVTV